MIGNLPAELLRKMRISSAVRTNAISGTALGRSGPYVAVTMGATSCTVFSLKGWNKKAQGIALGFERWWEQALKGRNKRPTCRLFCPFRAKNSQNATTQGVALGCLVLPLRGVRGDGKLLHHNFILL